MAEIKRRTLLAGMAALPAAACTELAETGPVEVVAEEVSDLDERGDVDEVIEELEPPDGSIGVLVERDVSVEARWLKQI